MEPSSIVHLQTKGAGTGDKMTGTTDDNDSSLWVEHLIDLLQAFRKYNPDATLNQALTFLIVARHDGHITQSQILSEEYLDMKTSGTSRVVNMLSKYGDRGIAGWNLIEAFEDPEDRRRKVLKLTAKGRAFLNTLRRDVERMKRIV